VIAKPIIECLENFVCYWGTHEVSGGGAYLRVTNVTRGHLITLHFFCNSVFSFRSQEVSLFVQWSRASVRSSKWIPLLVSVCERATSQRATVRGGSHRLKTVEPSSRHGPSWITSLPVDGHRWPWSAYQRQPSRAAALSARRDRRSNCHDRSNWYREDFWPCQSRTDQN